MVSYAPSLKICLVLRYIFDYLDFFWCFVLQVTSAQGNSHTHHYAENVHEGHFSFETAEGADYHTCFTAAVHKPPVKLTIDFDWKSGVAAKDWTNVAKKASVEVSTYFSFNMRTCVAQFIFFRICLSILSR